MYICTVRSTSLYFLEKADEENKLLQERHPNMIEKLDADHLVKNLMDYISTMNSKNNLRL